MKGSQFGGNHPCLPSLYIHTDFSKQIFFYGTKEEKPHFKKYPCTWGLGVNHIINP